MGPLLWATGCWLALALLLVTVMVAASSLVPSAAGAAGLGFSGYLTVAIAGLWGWAARFTPAGLVGAPDRLVRGEPLALGWPLVTSAVLAVVLAGAGIAAFARQEL